MLRDAIVEDCPFGIKPVVCIEDRRKGVSSQPWVILMPTQPDLLIDDAPKKPV
jgi:hypothetical protein